MGKRSIEARLQAAFSIDKVPPDTGYASALGFSADPTEKAKAWRDWLSDGERVRRAALALPLPCLVTMEVLLDHLGCAEHNVIVAELKRRMGLGPEDADIATSLLFEHGLAVSLSSPRGRAAALVLEAARHLLDLRGISLPSPPSAPIGPSVDASRERDLIALATLAAHRQLRATVDGSPHFASVKTFAKGLGPDAEDIFSRLQLARAEGLLSAHDKRLLPQRAELEATADQGLVSHWTGDIGAHLRSGEWVSLEEIAREPSVTEVEMWQRPTRQDWKTLRPRIGSLASVEHEGMVFVSRPARPTARTGDGHVTPNMDVMLGPDAHPEVVVTIGFAAELVRLDRILTYRLTRRSIQTAIGFGVTVERIIDALSVVGRHELAANVVANVQDFARKGSAVSERLVARVSVEFGDRVRIALQGAPFEEPAPFVFLVPTSHRRELEAALEAAGVGVVRAEPSGVARPRGSAEKPAIEASARASWERSLKTSFAADSKALRSRAAARGGVNHDRAGAGTLGAADHELLDRFALRVGKVVAAAHGRLEHWVRTLEPRERTSAEKDLKRGQVSLREIALLEPAELERGLASSRSLDALATWAAQHTSPATLEAREAALVGISVAELRRLLAASGAAFEALDEIARATNEDMMNLPGVGVLLRADRSRVGNDFDAFARSGENVLVEYRAGGVPRVIVMGVERLAMRGKQVVVLGTDLLEAEDVSIPLTDILGYELDPEIDGEWTDDDERDALSAEPMSLLMRPSGLGGSASNPAANVTRPSYQNVGRNDACPCGSGKKFKKCHG